MARIVTFIVNSLALLINGAILLSLISLFHQFVYQVDLAGIIPYVSFLGIRKIPSEFVPYILTVIILLCLVSVSFTPLADFVFRRIYGFRAPLVDEKRRLEYLFSKTCQAAGRDPRTMKIYVVDDQMPNGYAIGLNSIGISRGLLLRFPDDEVEAVLAHEIGHIFHGDSLQLRLYLTLSLVGQTALFIYRIVASILSGLSRVPIPIVNMFFLIISFIIRLQNWICQILLIAPLSLGALFGARRMEYRADKFAFSVGYGPSLYRFLYRILDMPGNSTGVFRILNSTHPSTAERIRRIYDLQQKSCSPAAATGFSFQGAR